MDIGSLLLGLALLLVIAFVIARPLLEQTTPDEQAASSADELLGSRERVLTQLRDLDFDQSLGKINPEDYTAQRAQLVAEGVAILRQLDALGTGEIALDQPAGARAAATTPDDAIEAAVAQLRARRAAAATGLNLDGEIEAGVAERRAARLAPARAAATAALPGASKRVDAAALACAQCGAEVLPNDQFCPQCGSPLTVACGNCGRVARAGDQFCAHCGQPLPAPVGGLRQAKAQS